MDWFERITGFRERPYDTTQRRLQVADGRLTNIVTGQTWGMGRFEAPTLRELRQRVAALPPSPGPLKVSLIRANASDLHVRADNRHALIQAASQFNALEMVSPDVTPEDGVTCYQTDATQGPACAIAAGAGTIYRNYLMDLPGGSGQTRERQLDALSGLGEAIGNGSGDLWTMRNGYAMVKSGALEVINTRLTPADPDQLDTLRASLRLPLHWDVQVTLPEAPADHYLSQIYCSALPVAYNQRYPRQLWRQFAALVLEAAYEGTLLAGVLNAERTGCPLVYLTRVGGGVFGNDAHWVNAAIRRALDVVASRRLDVQIVTLNTPDVGLRDVVGEFANGERPR